MSSLVKLSTVSRINKHLNLKIAGGIETQFTASYMGVQLSGNPDVTLDSGAEKGKQLSLINGDKLSSKARYVIDLGSVSPNRYHAIVEVNPILHRLGNIGHVNMVEPGEETIISLYFQPFTNCDLTNLDWYVRIYLLD